MHFVLVRCKKPSEGTTVLMAMTFKTIAMPAALRAKHLCELKERSSSASRLGKANKLKSQMTRSISATDPWPILPNKSSLLQQLVKRLLQGKTKLICISTHCRSTPNPPRSTDDPCTAWKRTLLRRAEQGSKNIFLATT